MAKKLNLKKEAVDLLSDSELGSVAGAAATQTCPTLDGCFTHTTTVDCVRRIVSQLAC